MTKNEASALFNAMHPGFFDQPSIRAFSEDQRASELVLDLKTFDENIYTKAFDDSVTFGLYDGAMPALCDAVARVNEAWVPYYDGSEPAYCGYVDGRIVSFALCSDMGLHELNGRVLRIGGPGCVGTLREFRHRGIGLTVVKNITAALRRDGYDLSWIHYTGVAPWYQRLGYEVVLTWGRDGIV